MYFLKTDKENLKEMLFESFNAYSTGMQLNILNYFRFGNIRCDKEMLELLSNEKVNSELRFAAIRYFEKFPAKEAESINIKIHTDQDSYDRSSKLSFLL